MSGTPISAEARGKLRLFKQTIETRFNALERAHPWLRGQVTELMSRESRKGRDRVFDRINARKYARLWDVKLTGKTSVALWATLRADESLMLEPPTPGDAQDGVRVEYLLIGRLLGDTLVIGIEQGLWSLEFKDHALGRFLQRHPTGDLTETLFRAHSAALRAPVDVLNLPDLLLPAGDGVFVCEPVIGQGDDDEGLLCAQLIAKTWLHHDQLRPGQTPVEAGEHPNRLGDGWMRPSALRDIRPEGDGVMVTTPEWADGFGAAPKY